MFQGIHLWNDIGYYLIGDVVLLVFIVFVWQVELAALAEGPGPPIFPILWPIAILLWLSCMVMTILILPGYISERSENINNTLTDWVAIIAAIVASISLYWLRGKAPLFYGVLEILVGFFSVYLASRVFGVTLLGKIIGLLGGMYIIVRGLDNLDKGMPDDFKPAWNRLFPKRTDQSSLLPPGSDTGDL